VPKARRLPPREAELLSLYERAERVLEEGGRDAVKDEFARVDGALCGPFESEWLLRWNLLESLLKLGQNGALAQRLTGELEALEVALDYRQPIASGMRYLRQRFSLSP
jgi:hypothetical protein